MAGIGLPIVVAAGATPSGVAAQISNAINAFVSAPDFSAGQSGANVVVTNATAGAAGAGAAIVVTTSQLGTVSSIGRLTVNLGPDNNSQTTATVDVQGTHLLCPAVAHI